MENMSVGDIQLNMRPLTTHAGQDGHNPVDVGTACAAEPPKADDKENTASNSARKTSLGRSAPFVPDKRAIRQYQPDAARNGEV